MKCINIEDISFESIQDTYTTCKYIERNGVPLDMVTLGNVHDSIEEAVDDNQLPITQVIKETAHSAVIEGYIIGGG